MTTKARILSLVVILLTLVALVGATGPVLAQGTPWIKLSKATAQEFLDNENIVKMSIPVILDNVPAQGVTVRLVAVGLDKRYEERIKAAFELDSKLQLPDPSSKTVANLSLDVNTIKAATQGTYNLLIEAESGNTGKPTQTLELQIVHPPAKLRPIDKIAVVQTVTPFFGAEVRGEPLILREDSGLSRITGINIQPLEFFGGIARRATSGSISFAKDSLAIPPRESGTLGYQLTGSFPLGTTSGIVRLTAPQLTEAFPIKFEVETRRPGWLIIPLILLGLVLGYFLRICLKKIEDLNQKRLEAMNLLRQFQEAKENNQDEDFKTEIAENEKALKRARDGSDIQVLTQAITGGTAALKTALDNLKTRRENILTTIKGLSGLLTGVWFLPREIKRVLEQAGNKMEQISPLIGKDNIKEANDVLADILRTMGDKLNEALNEWKPKQKDNLADLLNPNRPWPATVASNLKTTVDQINPLVDNLSMVEPPEVTTEKIQVVLAAIHNVHSGLRGFIQQLGYWLENTMNSVVTYLGRSEVLAKLQTDLTAFLNELKGKSQIPEDAFALLTPERLKLLDEQWAPAIRAMLPTGANQNQVNQVDQEIGEKRYEDAARTVKAIIDTLQLATGIRPSAITPLVGRIPELAPSPLLGGMEWFPRLEAVRPSPEVLFLPAIAPPPATEVTWSYSMRQLFWAKFGQSFIASIGITLVGYLLYYSKFVGTAPEMIQLVLYGFSLNVTMEALLSKIPALKPPG